MTEITTFIDWAQNIGFVGVLIVLAVPSLRLRIFGMNGNYKPQIQSLQKEVKEIKENHIPHLQDSINRMGKDVAYIKGRMEK